MKIKAWINKCDKCGVVYSGRICPGCLEAEKREWHIPSRDERRLKDGRKNFER